MSVQFACARLIEPDELTCCQNLPANITEAAVDAASDQIHLLAPSLAIGRCTETVRPCSDNWCGCGDMACACCWLPGIALDGWNPQVISVFVDGAEVPSGSYATINGSLVRFEGDGTPVYWPGCQTLTLPYMSVGTFQITYRHGIEVDLIVRNALAEIACDLLAPYKTGRAQLPRGTTDATMNSVSVRLDPQNVDPALFPWLTRFLTTWGITPGRPEASVWSPEMMDWTMNVVT